MGVIVGILLAVGAVVAAVAGNVVAVVLGALLAGEVVAAVFAVDGGVALPLANAGATEESFGERNKERGLPNEALVFRVGAAKRIVRSGVGCRHDGRRLYHRESPRLRRVSGDGFACGDA